MEKPEGGGTQKIEAPGRVSQVAMGTAERPGFDVKGGVTNGVGWGGLV